MIYEFSEAHFHVGEPDIAGEALYMKYSVPGSHSAYLFRDRTSGACWVFSRTCLPSEDCGPIQ
jgi:hypothetical protein